MSCFVKSWKRWAASLSLLVCLPAFALAADPEVVEVERDTDGKAGTATIRVRLAKGDHWIGGHFVPASDVLKAQLQLEQGLVAMHVVEKSPAAKAGVEKHDVLVSYNGKKLTDVQSLIDAVAKSKGKKVECQIVRGGSEKTLKIASEERPAQMAAIPTEGKGGTWLFSENMGQTFGDMSRWIDKDGMRVLLARPGVLVPSGVVKAEGLPDDLRVIIVREGKKPATITVRRGENKWETTEDDVDELPEVVRKFVKPMIGSQGKMQIRVEAELEKDDVKDGDSKDKASSAIRRRIVLSPEGSKLSLPELGDVQKQIRDHVIRVERLHSAGSGGMDDLRKEMKSLRDEIRELKKLLRAKSEE